MSINFAAASTAGLNNPGTEIITLVKNESGNFVNPPSYDKMRAYLRSGEVPMLFVSAEDGETGSLYQLDEYSETENKIRFSNSANAIEFCAGASAPVVSDVGGGGGSNSGQLIVTVTILQPAVPTFAADKTYAEISAAIDSGMSVILHFQRSQSTYNVFYHSLTEDGYYEFCSVKLVAGTSAYLEFISIYEENGEMVINKNSIKLQSAT